MVGMEIQKELQKGKEYTNTTQEGTTLRTNTKFVIEANFSKGENYVEKATYSNNQYLIKGARDCSYIGLRLECSRIGARGEIHLFAKFSSSDLHSNISFRVSNDSEPGFKEMFEKYGKRPERYDSRLLEIMDLFMSHEIKSLAGLLSDFDGLRLNSAADAIKRLNKILEVKEELALRAPITELVRA